MSISSDPRLGSELLGYRLDAVVGRGGMGVVYRAFDVRLKRHVALKLLSPELAADSRFHSRFLVETELAASLEHPNVVPLHDAGEAEGQLYLVMRYVPGPDLKRLLASEGPLPAERALAICAQAAAALDAAHERGLVHRDVKPSNVLLDREEHAYLGDFGLTRRLAEQAPGFDAGLSLGTPAYVAPEQIEGKEVDGRADQYSLACLLYECLAGKAPFPRASEAAMLFAHLEEPPPVFPGLERVFGRALAKDPGARYESCTAFVAAARDALGIAEQRPRRGPLAAAVVGVAVVGAVLLGFFLTRDGSSPAALAEGRLLRLDGAGRVESAIAVGTEPNAVALSQGKVWVTDRAEKTISRVDRESGAVEVESPAHGTPTDVAVRGSNVVVTHGPSESGVVFFSAATGGEARSHALAEGLFAFGSPHVATHGDQIWIATGGRSVGRWSFVRGRLESSATIPRDNDEADSFVSEIDVDDEGVWAIGDPNQSDLWRLDPRTQSIVATIALPSAPTDVATGLGAVWVSSQMDDVVMRIDPETNRVTDTIPVGRGADAIATGAGSVWVAGELDATVSRIDPVSLEVESVDVGGTPLALTADDAAVWVTTRPLPTEAPPDTVAIGVVASCEGPFASFADLSFAGAELPLLRRGARLVGAKPSAGVRMATAAGREIELFLECGDDSAQTALEKARRLVEGVGVDVLIGSTQASEAFPIRDYARRQPQATFLGGTAYPQALTLHGAPSNYFRFTPDGPQWTAGLGSYAFHELGWRRVVTIADDWLAGYVTTAGFAAEFCSLGGKIVDQIWTPLGTADVSGFVGRVPDEGVDGFLMAGISSTTQGFIDRLPQLRGDLSRKIVGTVFLWELVDAGEPLGGVVVAEPLGPEPRASAFMSGFRRTFPDLAPYAWDIWSVFFHNPMEAALTALESVDGQLDDGHKAFRAALSRIRLNAPNGTIRLDARRQAIAPNYLVNYRKPASGGPPVTRSVKTIEAVEQTFNGYFRPDGPPLGRDTIECKRGRPPHWARS